MSTFKSSEWRCFLKERVLYAVAFLDLFAVSMIIPSLSTYVKAMDGGKVHTKQPNIKKLILKHVGAIAFGGIMSMYGAIQFFSAPIAGSLSDVYGRKRVLMVATMGASLGYFLLGMSWNIYMVILSRIPSALFKHTLDLIRVAVTDGEDPTTRSSAIGRLNASSSAGFILGPMIGGYISALGPYGFNYTAMLTTIMFGVNYFLLATFYSEETSSKAHQKGRYKVKVNWSQILNDAMAKVLDLKHVMYETGPAKTILLARLLLAMAAILYRTHFSTSLEDKFGADPKTRGFVLSYMGFLGAFGSFSVGIISKW
jgi:MFS family permease